ncbi:MAG: proline iminopeptidase-family hydrolase [Pseudomonadota bacterium]
MTESLIKLSNGHSVWTKVVGDGPGIPVLLMHGGPGSGHDYLEPLEALAVDRPVVFYDQLGCGKSDIPDNKSLWTIERFADEIDEVRHALNLDRCHYFGQSWGGWLGVEYLIRKPTGIASAVLASTSSSIPQFSAECDKLIDALPPEHRRALQHYGERGEYGHPDYAAAEEVFYQRHLCRLEQWPDCIMRSIENLHHTPVYETINGPNEFTTIGNLRYWDRTLDLPNISVPVLITCGRFDELGPPCAETLHAGIKESTVQIFEESAHVAHLEEPEKYMACLREFFATHD